jgi:hypothetical protein
MITTTTTTARAALASTLRNLSGDQRRFALAGLAILVRAERPIPALVESVAASLTSLECVRGSAEHLAAVDMVLTATR